MLFVQLEPNAMASHDNYRLSCKSFIDATFPLAPGSPRLVAELIRQAVI
jgi:hypothetical protein